MKHNYMSVVAVALAASACGNADPIVDDDQSLGEVRQRDLVIDDALLATPGGELTLRWQTPLVPLRATPPMLARLLEGFQVSPPDVVGCVSTTGASADEDGDGVPRDETWTFNCLDRSRPDGTHTVTGKITLRDTDDLRAYSGRAFDFTRLIVGAIDATGPRAGWSESGELNGGAVLQADGGGSYRLARGYSLRLISRTAEGSLVHDGTLYGMTATAYRADDLVRPFEAGTETFAGASRFVSALDGNRAVTERSYPDLHYARACGAFGVAAFDQGRLIVDRFGAEKLVQITFESCGVVEVQYLPRLLPHTP